MIGDGLPTDPTHSSAFSDLLRSLDLAPTWSVPNGSNLEGLTIPEATTVIAARFEGGAVMVGDRQATEGYTVANRRMEKVFSADEYSVVAISGTAGLAIELVRLFKTELEHYEKLEGVRLSLEGKANYLARMVRQQLPMAMQGLVVVPLFCGFDHASGQGRVYTFDVVGGQYEEFDFGATGSGSREAKSYLRNAYDRDADLDGAVDAVLRSLVSAAELDVATSGPDVRRGIFPTIMTVTADGVHSMADEEIAQRAERAMEIIR